MTAKTMEQMLDEFGAAVQCRRAFRQQRIRDSRDAILVRFSELERERDEARAAAEEEFGNVMALSAERDAYRADAERMRWVMSQAWFQDEAEFRLSLSDEEDSEKFAAELRAAIDAAIAQRAGETG